MENAVIEFGDDNIKAGPRGALNAATAGKAPMTEKQLAAIKEIANSGGGEVAKILADDQAKKGVVPEAPKEMVQTAEQQLQAQEDAYMATSDMLSLLKKGIRYDQSWMNSKYKNVLKESTLDSFRTALVEFAVLEAKMGTDDDFKKAVADNAWNIAAKGGAAMGELNLAKKGDKRLSNLVGYNVGANEAGYATGGSIDYDQMARLHKGEMVVPKGGMLVKGGDGGGGKTVNVNATINVTTGADPKEIAAAVHDLYRAH